MCCHQETCSGCVTVSALRSAALRERRGERGVPAFALTSPPVVSLPLSRRLLTSLPSSPYLSSRRLLTSPPVVSLPLLPSSAFLVLFPPHAGFQGFFLPADLHWPAAVGSGFGSGWHRYLASRVTSLVTRLPAFFADNFTGTARGQVA